MLKLKCIAISLTAVIAIFFITPNVMNAQKTTPVSSDVAANANAIEALPVCTDIIPLVTKKFQMDADRKCETKTTCIKCKMKDSDNVIYANVIVQPQGACKNRIRMVEDSGVATSKEPARTSRGGAAVQIPEANDFSGYDIIQKHCAEGGTNLDVYIPGDALALAMESDGPSTTYSFLWTIDGKKAGHEKSLSCACGQEAKVRVTDSDSGRSVSRTVLLQKCTGDR